MEHQPQPGLILHACSTVRKVVCLLNRSMIESSLHGCWVSSSVGQDDAKQGFSCCAAYLERLNKAHKMVNAILWCALLCTGDSLVQLLQQSAKVGLAQPAQAGPPPLMAGDVLQHKRSTLASLASWENNQTSHIICASMPDEHLGM